MTGTILAVTAEGGSVSVAILAVLALGAAVLYSARIAYTLFERSRDAGSDRVRYLALGLVLLATAPIVLRFGLATATGAPTPLIPVVTGLSELAGLGAILYAIYVPGGERR